MTTELPKQVQAELAAAEALEQHVYGPGQASPTEQPAEPAVDTEPAAPPAEPVAQPAPVVTTAVPDQDANYWRTRFETLRGKYDAEVPTLIHQLREQGSQLQTLTQQLESTKKPEAPEPSADPLVTQKDDEVFGSDLVDMTKRAAQDVFRQMVPGIVSELRAEFAAMKEQLGAVADRQVMSDEQKFWGAVAAAIPNWRTVDDSPEWGRWLDGRAVGARASYRQLAQDAVAAFEVEPLKELVTLFTSQTGFGATAPTVKPTPPVSPELQRQIPPSTSRASDTPPAARIWTTAEIEQLGDPRFMNSMAPDEYAALQADADRAVVENRVRW